MDHSDRLCAHTHSHAGSDFAAPGAKPHYPPDLELEPRHLDISLRLDIPQRAADAVVVLTVVATRAGVQRLILQALDFEGVTVRDPAGRELDWRYDGRELNVRWRQPANKDESRDLEIRYRVENPAAGLYFSHPDAAHPERAQWVATDHETERARYWLPCVDHPSARTTLAFHLTADGSLTILANGLLEREATNADGTKTAHWRLDHPCPSYLACFVAGDLVRADDEPVGGRQIAAFGLRGRTTEADLKRAFGATPGIMRWLEKRVGRPFPFPKYFQFAVPGIGGAMENISLVSWDDRFLPDAVLHREIGDLIDQVNVHEMAHSYFGDSVVIRDFAHAWLKESWATYLEYCWYGEERSEDEMRYELVVAAHDYIHELDNAYARPIVTRVYDSSWQMFDRHLYPGGAWRLHMLRKLLGDDVFWPAVTDYLATYEKKLAETDDFRQKLEHHSGRSLDRFFEQWLRGVGCPRLKVEMEQDDERGTITFKLTQTQVPEAAPIDGKPALTPFHFPLTIAWEGPEATWTRKAVEVDGRFHSFTFACAGKPLQVRIDPDGALLHSLEFNPGDAPLRRALTHGPDVAARILAAGELAKTAKLKNLEAIATAYPAEPFWGVRRGFGEAVADAKGGRAATLLAGFLAVEIDPRVQVILARRAGELRDPRIAEALRSLLDRGPTYRVAAAALEALGKQRGEADLARLEAAADDPGYRAIVRAGALRGLAETRTERAFQRLKARIGYGAEREDAAPAAVLALAECAVSLERRHREAAYEAIVDQATDPRQTVRSAVATALGRCGIAQGADVIDSMLMRFPLEERPRLRRLALRLRGGDPEKTANAQLSKRLETLEDQHRKLEERLLAVEGRATS